MAVGFLVFGLNSSIYEPPKLFDRGYDVRIKEPSKPIDVEAMSSQVQKPLSQRIAVNIHGGWDIDGVISVYRYTKSKTWDQVSKNLWRMAIGSALLATATVIAAWQSKSPVSWVAFVAFGAFTIACFYRYRQAGEQQAAAKALELEIPQPQEKFAAERAKSYPQKAQDVLKGEITEFFSSWDVLLPNPILHPSEGEFFFRQFFKDWTDGILNPQIKTSHEKSEAVSSFLMHSSLFKHSRLNVNAALFLVDASRKTSQLYNDLMPLFDQHWKFQEAYSTYYTTVLQNQVSQRNIFRDRLLAKAPAIYAVLNRGEMDFTKQRYCDLALQAALPTPLLDFLANLHAACKESDAKIYEKVATFVREAVAFMENRGPVPSDVTLDPFEFPPLPEKLELLPLDVAWIERAKALQLEHNPEKYLQFLDEIVNITQTPT